ncbi:hypothetical protein MVEN_02300800 [Mycena venus]|uniref:DUF6533 domain-containing protein n=1 Tax=Mycena venus TaxID=2733690 RepID=A0A8H6X5V3_9AGAR|nr:hypothetical protein MVEN_02300800 [Mycena venus]
MDSTGLPHSAFVAFQNVLITRYVSAAGLVILLYDHLLTLQDEIEYIWSAPSTVAKTLFLILRYMVPSFLTAQTISAFFATPVGRWLILSFKREAGWPQFQCPMWSKLCKTWTSFATYAGWLSIVISNFLVLLRIWTTLPRNNRLIGWSIVFFVLMQLAGFAVTTWVITTMIPVLIFEHTAGMCTFSSKPKVFALWMPGLFFEVVVFATICWNMLDRPRDADDRITRILFRDGVAYFLILFILRIANVVIAIVAPISLIFVIVFFIWAATTVTTSRLIINSRREAGKAERLRVIENAELQSGDKTGDTRRLRSLPFGRQAKGTCSDE